VDGELKLIAPGDLRPHEDVDPERVALLVDEMRAADVFYPPILIDDATGVILDGHHRWRASIELGLRVLPCYCVDYLHDDLVRIMSRRDDVAVDKPGVIATALRGAVYPRKTTRHMYDLPETIEPIPLARLR
jgi:L-serine kinase (ADP)